MEGDGFDGAQWDTVFTALSDPYRRELLVALLKANPQDDEDIDPLNTASDFEKETDILKIEMFHTHLPKLEEEGFIEWDREAGQIRKGPNWDEIAPLLQLIQDHHDELPAGWL
jgi:hypothetical protein